MSKDKIIDGLQDAIRFVKGEYVERAKIEMRIGDRRLSILEDGPKRFVLSDNTSDEGGWVYETQGLAFTAMLELAKQ